MHHLLDLSPHDPFSELAGTVMKIPGLPETYRAIHRAQQLDQDRRR